ncbi:hypothetical protein ACU5AX_19315 [Sphingomonas sp. XXL09]|uniref:hypothetical protein n=1 Tax=Sphingomonas sp. XXL09 TaxID=3457787 RepID=UPI00406BC67F
MIDIGAYHGDWTKMVHRVLGSLPTLMIEAQPQRDAMLQQTCHDLEDVQYVSAVLT